VIPYQYISIEGNIGAGKSSLAVMLAEEFNSRLVLEEFAENPFLRKFYESPDRYAFPLELSFLSERFSQLKREVISGDIFQPQVVSDYFLAKCQIFAKNNLQGDEYALFLKLYEVISTVCPSPDLLVYLYRDVRHLQDNIRRRGRDYEQNISDTYLDGIQQQYLDFLKQHQHLRILIIQLDDMDFVANRSDYEWLRNVLCQKYELGLHLIDTPKANS
jgi:deoxyadenosine/deoxycytidine kinase